MWLRSSNLVLVWLLKYNHTDYDILYLGSGLIFFNFISLIENRGKANFFERRVGEYQKASVMSSLQDGGKNFVFKLDEDF